MLYLFLNQVDYIVLCKFMILFPVIFLVLKLFKLIYDLTEFGVVKVIEQPFPFLEWDKVQINPIVLVVLSFEFCQ